MVVVGNEYILLSVEDRENGGDLSLGWEQSVEISERKTSKWESFWRHNALRLTMRSGSRQQCEEER